MLSTTWILKQHCKFLQKKCNLDKSKQRQIVKISLHEDKSIINHSINKHQPTVDCSKTRIVEGEREK